MKKRYKMKAIKMKLMALLLVGMFILSAQISAQVTIGAGTPPQDYSILEIVSNSKGGLRLPQLTTKERNDITTAYSTELLMRGLLIYNLDSKCQEYWNGTKWVSLCLGTANITLTCEDGSTKYDPSSPPVAPPDGGQAGCTYIPVDDPACIVPSGQAYQVYLTAGSSYAMLTVDEITSAFSVQFQPNNSANTRIAVVRVVNNCSGEFQDFIFTQQGETCPNAQPFTVSTNSTELCGDNGAVIAYINSPEAGMNYLWTFGGVVISEGVYMEITRPGTYVVYAGLLGCTIAQPQTVTITKIAGSSATAPVISANNSGILCDAGAEVWIRASNLVAGTTVQWFHDGAHQPSHDGQNPLKLSGASNAGEWFAVQIDSPCGSQMSNIVTLVDWTSQNAIPAPVARVNGEAWDTPPTVCKGGTLELEVTNAATYPADTWFEWFNGSQSIVRTNQAKIYYTLPADANEVILSLQVTNLSGGCPVTITTTSMTATTVAPAITGINNGAQTASICGNMPAILQANYISGTTYEWFHNGVVIATQTSGNPYIYSATLPGDYTVRYMDGTCWSPISSAISVVQSAPIDLSWQLDMSNLSIIEGTTKSISVFASPAGDSYDWTWTDENPGSPVGVSITEIGDGRTASVQFPNVGSGMLKVTATNSCGPVSIEHRIVVNPGCSPIVSVNIPTGSQTRYFDLNGYLKAGNSATIALTAQQVGGGNEATGWQWFVGGNQVGTTGSGTISTFNYTIPTPITAAATLDVYAVATNGCGTKETNHISLIYIKDNPAPNPQVMAARYRLSGRTTYDVKRGNDNDANMRHSLRIDNFASTKTFAYNLYSLGGAGYSNLVLSVENDASGLITNAVQNGSVLNVTFRDDINTFAQGRDKNSALTFNVIARFHDIANNQDLQLSINVKVQDSSPGCPVKTASGGILIFQSFNLGADENMTVAQQINYAPSNALDETVYGWVYQWGRQADGHQRRSTTRVNYAAQIYDVNGQINFGQPLYGAFVNSGSNWRSTTNNNLWNNSLMPTNNPCAPGWRLPTRAEFVSIFRTSGPSTSTQGLNTANVNSWSLAPSSSNRRGLAVTPSGSSIPTLFLPLGGWRNGDASFSEENIEGNYYYSDNPGNAFHYSNTRGGVQSARNINLLHGASCRCVEE